MKRCLFNLLMVLSLLLCVAVMALWVRSTIVSDVVCATRDGDILQTYTLRTLRGGFQFEAYRRELRRPHPWLSHASWEWETMNPQGQPLWTPPLREGLFDYLHLRPVPPPGALDSPSLTVRADRADDGLYVNTWRGAVAPYWPLCAAAAVAPAVRLLATIRLPLRGRGHQDGLCPRCGYDLRATPDRCPECGTGAQAPT